MPEQSKIAALSWRKSRASITGECVEVAATEAVVAVRDSKDREGTIVICTVSAWREFLRKIGDGA